MKGAMLLRFMRLWVVVGLLVGLWAVGSMTQSDRGPGSHPGSRPGPVRILQFYANMGDSHPGAKGPAVLWRRERQERADLSADPGHLSFAQPLPGSCTGTYHALHLLAEGYDGRVATQSFTLAVQAIPVMPQIMQYAGRSYRIAQAVAPGAP